MTTVINGSSPSITFSDSTTQSTAALPLTGGTLTGGLTLPSTGITFSDASTQTSAPVGSSVQSWQNVLGSRTFGTTYTNSTGRPIMVYVQANQSGAAYMNESVRGFNSSMAPAVGSPTISLNFIVQSGGTYNVSNQGVVFTPDAWKELR